MLLGDPVDHLLDEDGLADAGSAEQADLAALHVGLQQVDDLDAGLEHERPRLELVEGRARCGGSPNSRRAADGVGVERLAEHVEDVAEHGVADRHLNTVAEVAHGRPAHEAIGLLHADAAHPASPICWATSAAMVLVSPSSSTSNSTS